MKPILFFSDKCSDTPPFVAKLQALNIAYEAINITADMPNLKRFLALRDTHPAFLERKKSDYIAIPVLLLESGEVIFEVDELESLHEG